MTESDKQFVHLHVHTEASRLDGMSSAAEIIDTAVEYGMPAVAITNHGNMVDMIKALDRVKSKNYPIKLIPGLEAYQAEDRFAKSSTESGKRSYHLILLAINTTGYRNLMHISSESNKLESTYYGNPRVDLDLLRQYSEGIVCTSSCLGSSVNQALLDGDRDLAVERAQEFIDIFGRDRYFIEIQDHSIPEQHKILDDQVWLAEKLGVGLVAAQDSHYTHEHEAGHHEAMLALQSGSTLSDPGRFKFHGTEHYFKSGDEMWELFPEDAYPGACANTLKIADMVEDIDFNYKKPNGYLLPHFPIPDGFETELEYLRHLTIEGLEERFGKGEVPKKYLERADYELSVIEQMGFPGYFLILWSGIKWIKSRGRYVGPGRGSGGGSLVLYATHITTVDPIKFDLPFERFLNPGRLSLPDVDMDVEEIGREELIQYYTAMFGEDRVSRIGTIGRFRAKESIKSSFRVLGLPVQEAAQLVKMYPAPVSQGDIPLWVLMEEKLDRELASKYQRQWRDGSEFRSTVRSNPEYQQAIDIALSLEGVARQLGIHPAGLLITPGPVADYFPTRQDPDSGAAVTQYDLYDVEKCGGVKIDFLGLMNLDLIQRAVQLIRDDLGEHVDLDNLPLDDKAVYRMLSKGDTDGVFQLVSSGMQQLLIAMQPDNFLDISASLALFRPGPMGMNTHMEYADRKNGRKPIDVPHPEMMDILKETYGLVVYQEQIMALAVHFAGYAPSEADNFRKAMGKKDADEMARQHPKFLAAVKERGYGDLGETLWNIIEPFSGYAFNKSHSVAYGHISYQTAYLKAHYPAQYAAACIEFMGKDSVATQVASARRQGVEVYSPNINKSRGRAATSRNAIWLGMNGIKQCGAQVVEAIVQERDNNGEYKDFADFLVRTRLLKQKVTKRAVSGLVYAGAFDDLHKSRKVLIENIDDMIVDAKTEAENKSGFSSVESLFDFGDDLNSVMSGYDLSSTDDYDSSERVRYELEYVGFFAGKHPFTEVESLIDDAKVVGRLDPNATEPDPEVLKVGDAQVYGILTELEHHRSKNGKLRSTFTIETSHERRLNAILFGYHLSDSLQGSFVNVKGAIKEDIVDGADSGDSIIALQMNATEVSRVDLRSVDENAPERRRRALRAINGERRRQKVETVVEEEAPKVEQTVEEAVVTPLEPRKRRTRKVPVEPTALDEMIEATTPMALNDEQPSEIEGEIIDNENDADTDTKYRFYVIEPSDLKALNEMLVLYGKGNNKVHVNFESEDITHDSLTFKLSEEAVSEIAQTIGIDWEVIE